MYLCIYMCAYVCMNVYMYLCMNVCVRVSLRVAIIYYLSWVFCNQTSEPEYVRHNVINCESDVLMPIKFCLLNANSYY